MSTREIIVVAALSFLLGAGLVYGLQSNATAKARGEAKAYQDQLDVVLVSLELRRAAQAAADSTAAANDSVRAAEIRYADARRVAAEARGRAAEARQPEVVRGIAERAGADSAVARAAAQEATDSITVNVISPLRTALFEAQRSSVRKDSTIADRDLQIATRDRVQADLEAALALSQAKSASLERALPGWFSRNQKWIYGAGGITIGWFACERLCPRQ